MTVPENVKTPYAAFREFSGYVWPYLGNAAYGPENGPSVDAVSATLADKVRRGLDRGEVRVHARRDIPF